MPKGEIFISYRRDDTGEPNRLHDALAKRFGKKAVVFDRTDIDYGTDFPDWIREAVTNAKVVLVLIGRRWVSFEDEEGNRRLKKEGDWVAEEVALALEHAPRVIPVLLDEAELPREEDLPPRLLELPQKQLCEISPTRWKYDVGQLCDSIDLFLRGGRERPPMRREAMLTVAATCLMMLLASVSQVLNIVPGKRAVQNRLASWLEGFFEAESDPRGKVVLILEDTESQPGETAVARRARRRENLSRLLDGLSRAQAEVVVFDYFFEDVTEEEADRALAASLASSPVPAVLGVRSFRMRPDTTVGAAVELEVPLLLEEFRSDSDGWGLIQTRRLKHAVGSPLPRIELARLRHTASPIESGELWPSLALRTAMYAVGASRARYLGDEKTIRLSGAELEDPLTIPVRYVSGAEPGLMYTFRPGAYRSAEPIQLETVLHWCDNDPGSLDRFKDRVVIVGSADEQGLADFGYVEGYRLHAAVVEGLLRNHHYRVPDLLMSTLGLLTAAFAGTWWRLRKRRPRAIVEAVSPYTHWALTVADLAVGSFLFLIPVAMLALVVFMQGKLVLPVLYWLAASVVAYLALSVIERRQET